jgi:hypothetical protein
MTSGNDPQCFDKRGAAAETLFGTLRKRARQHQIEFWRFLRRNRRGGRRRRLHMRHDQLRRCTGEGHNAGDHLIGDNRQRIEVAPSIDALRRRLFRRNILRRSHKNAGARETLAIRRLRNAEIGQQHAPFNIDQDVVRLDIAVHRPLSMRMVKRIGDRSDNADGDCQPQCATLTDDRVQRSPAHIFHCDVA